MGNVQPTEFPHQQDNRSTSSPTSPFLFQPCAVPAQPFAVQKKGIVRRRVRAALQPIGIADDRGTTEESSTTSSLPSAAGKGAQLPSKLPSYRTILQQLIERQDWQRVLCRIELYPDEVNQYMPLYIENSMLGPADLPNKSSSTFKISMQSIYYSIIYVTPLHIVCALNPPLLVVTTILRLGSAETASVPIRPNTRRKRTIKKDLFWQHQRHSSSQRASSRLIKSVDSTNRKPQSHQGDDQSQISNDTPSAPSKWQILQSASSDSSNWHHKLNFRFSFDDYRQRVKYSIRHRRGRAGAFPTVEELNEDSDEDVDSVGRFDFQQQLEPQPSSIVTGNIATATTADCSNSHQSSSTETPPRFADQTIILQLSSSGGVHPFPVRMVQNVKSPVTSSIANMLLQEEHENVSPNTTAPDSNARPRCKLIYFGNSQNHSSVFRVRWDLAPLLRHVVQEGILLPLHVATLYSASSDVLRALVEAYPLGALRDVFGMLPIHFVAAGWLLPPLLPPPVSILVQQDNNADISNASDGTTASHCEALENLTTLQQAVPDSVRIRSGNHGMKPEEYINECMENGPYKDACLRLVNESLNINPGTDTSPLFDMNTSISSSTDDIFDFNESLNNSVDDLKIKHAPLTESSFDQLSSLIAARDWHSISVAIEMYPHLATKWVFGIDDTSASMYKRLPIHCACLYGGPIDLICKLIKLYPDGVKKVDPTDLSTPLSLACFANASIEVIRLILLAYPTAIDIVNVYGQVPLHVAILSKVPYDVVELLVGETPHLVLLKDFDGRTPINYAKTVYGEKHIVSQFLLIIKDVLLTDKFHC